MERKHSSKALILDICSMRSRAKKLLQLTPEYTSILQAITSKDYYNDSDSKIPSIKDLCVEAKISYSVARKQLQLIYDDLCSDEDHLNFPFEFNKVEILIGIRGYYGHRTIMVDSLPIIPRKGERVQVPFFKELTGTDSYHVDEIHHELMDGKQQVYISLKHGAFDSYWNLRKDQALATREISWQDIFHKSDEELKQLLDLKRGKAW